MDTVRPTTWPEEKTGKSVFCSCLPLFFGVASTTQVSLPLLLLLPQQLLQSLPRNSLIILLFRLHDRGHFFSVLCIMKDYQHVSETSVSSTDRCVSLAQVHLLKLLFI